MQMPARNYKPGSDYRFGFQGQEKDDEVKGNGNTLDFGARIYDSRLGRWLSVDPLAREYPWLTPYQFAGNTPIAAYDPNGKEIIVKRKPGEGVDGKDLVLIKVTAKWIDKTGNIDRLNLQKSKVAKIRNTTGGKYRKEVENLERMQKSYDEFAKNEMKEFKQIVESSYSDIGSQIEWKTQVDIEIGTKENLNPSDHVFYAVKNVIGTGDVVAKVNYVGGKALYYNPSDYGNFTIEKVKTHEFGHNLGLLHNFENLFNGMSLGDFQAENDLKSFFEVEGFFGIYNNAMDFNLGGTSIIETQILQIEKLYNSGLLNSGTNDYNSEHKGNETKTHGDYTINYEK